MTLIASILLGSRCIATGGRSLRRNETTASRTINPNTTERETADLDIATHEILEGLAQIHSWVIVNDLQGEIVWMSDALSSACGGAERYFGRHIEDLFAAIPGARVQARVAEQVAQVRQHLLHDEILNDIRFDLGTCDGRTRSVDVSAFRTTSQDGRSLVVSIVHPDSHSRVPDPILRGERDALGSILDSSPEAVLAIDRFGFVTYANPTVQSVLGLEPAQLLDRPIAIFLPRSPDFVKLVAKIRGGDMLDDTEFEIQHADGRCAWVALTAREHKRADGRKLGMVVTARDVTRRVRKRQDLEHKNAELESSMHSVAHDLRSPLVSLIGFTRLLREEYDAVLDRTGRHFADRIEQAARTMESLLHDLLELSRIGATQEQRSLVDPRSVLLQLRAELKLRLDEQGATLEIPEDPPLLLCDQMRLYQLFSNLVGNALQHMGPCDDRRITVEIDRSGSHDVISVTDRGRGVPIEDHKRIFDVFQSCGSTTDGRRSTGVGLAIVRRIAETHGGRAWVESEPGRGARFCVDLPCS